MVPEKVHRRRHFKSTRAKQRFRPVQPTGPAERAVQSTGKSLASRIGCKVAKVELEEAVSEVASRLLRQSTVRLRLRTRPPSVRLKLLNLGYRSKPGQLQLPHGPTVYNRPDGPPLKLPSIERGVPRTRMRFGFFVSPFKIWIENRDVSVCARD
jgi:hypothetical protein